MPKVVRRRQAWMRGSLELLSVEWGDEEDGGMGGCGGERSSSGQKHSKFRMGQVVI